MYLLLTEVVRRIKELLFWSLQICAQILILLRGLRPLPVEKLCYIQVYCWLVSKQGSKSDKPEWFAVRCSSQKCPLLAMLPSVANGLTSETKPGEHAQIVRSIHAGIAPYAFTVSRYVTLTFIRSIFIRLEWLHAFTSPVLVGLTVLIVSGR